MQKKKSAFVIQEWWSSVIMPLGYPQQWGRSVPGPRSWVCERQWLHFRGKDQGTIEGFVCLFLPTGFLTLALLASGTDEFFPMHGRMFSSDCNFSLLDTSSKVSLSLPKMSPDRAQWSSGEENCPLYKKHCPSSCTLWEHGMTWTDTCSQIGHVQPEAHSVR